MINLWLKNKNYCSKGKSPNTLKKYENLHAVKIICRLDIFDTNQNIFPMNSLYS